MIFLKLFATFFEIGLFTFGGGYAMISIVFEKVLNHGWLTEAELLNMIAVSESTPGPIAVNMATFVGSTQAGILGSLCATLGVVLPSSIIILLISAIIKNFLQYEGVKAFLLGVRPCVVGLIVGTSIDLFVTNILSIDLTSEDIISPDYKGLVIIAVVALVSFAYKKVKGKKPSPILLIIISAGLGALIYSF